ncbi:hypothetical protein BG011_005959 [Mortierella polycephala]|uniref:beta-N-acetylhexosaminidase n=1 Tax=Mortierella polycephala TaxID=41804 RepID=A0A9P6U9D9_9FUNG|nr:hypothetical protein BG011_005959 [Mortierella polycephala]
MSSKKDTSSPFASAKHSYAALNQDDSGVDDTAKTTAMVSPSDIEGHGRDSSEDLTASSSSNIQGNGRNTGRTSSLRQRLQEPEVSNIDSNSGNRRSRRPLTKDTFWNRRWIRYAALAGIFVILVVLIVLLILKPWQSKYKFAPVRNDAVKMLPGEQPIWPIPRSFSFGSDSVRLSRDFKIKVQSSESNQPVLPLASFPILDKAIIRCMDRLQLKRNQSAPTRTSDYSSDGMIQGDLSELVIVVDNAQAPLEYGMAESYTISIAAQGTPITTPFQASQSHLEKKEHHLTSSSPQERALPEDQDVALLPMAILRASTQWGVIQGLETFTQLVLARTTLVDPASMAVVVNNDLEIPNVPWSIHDEPRYSHRGILLDTSRHYLPVKDIIRTLDAMSVVKLNVFHWHVLDQQSYPLVSKTYPDLTAKGSERPEYVYTPQDVQAIIQHGEERGIRIIPEFDSPGHAASWGRSYPNLTVCLDAQPHAKYAAEPPAGQLDPLEPFTYTVLDGLVKEWAAQFPDKHMHFGGDEVNFECWKMSERLRDYIEHPAHRSRYEDSLLPTVTDPKEENRMLRTDTGRQSGEDRLLELYLDKVFGMYLAQGKRPIVWEEMALEHNVKLPSSAIVQVWKNAGNAKRVYSYSLTDKLDEDQQKMVYGGEVCMWTEQTDSSNLDPNLWPRSAAAAEVLWSGNQDDHGNERPLLQAASRISAVRERLVQMGVAAAPLFPSWCSKHPETCLS